MPHRQQLQTPSTTPTSSCSKGRSCSSVPSQKSVKQKDLPPSPASPQRRSPVNNNKPKASSNGTKAAPAKKAPWRSPGKWQMPDIIQETWKQRQQQQQQQKEAAAAAANQTQKSSPRARGDDKQQAKRPWIPVGKSPSIIPLPPPQRVINNTYIHDKFKKKTYKQQKRHPEFEAKVRKVLPRSKIMDFNPHAHYMAMARIGSGANGAVVRATKYKGPANKSQVAIKRCLIEDHDTNHHAYVLRELRIMGCFNHPNLIQLKEAGMWGDDLWMAMELMQCSVFNLLFNTTCGLSEAFTVRIAKECLEGLIYLHSKNYMHRDVKCENILLGRDGQVKLADFGLASPLNKTNKARLGTAKWMAPEVIAEEPYTENVDVWSLAITMIEMMDRVPPLYHLDDNRMIFSEILYGRPPTFSFTVPSRGMNDLVKWMLEPDGEKRPYPRDVRSRIKQMVLGGQLQCAKQSELAARVQEVFPHGL